MRDHLPATGASIAAGHRRGRLLEPHRVNKNVKHDRIVRAVPLTRDELKAVAVGGLERLKKCPGIVRGFFGDPKLAYIHA